MMLNIILRRLGIDISNHKRFHPERIIFAIKRIFPPSESELSLRRMINLIATFVKWRYGFNIPKVKIKPVILMVETVRGCNLNCVMCGAGEFKLRTISLDQFRRIVDSFPEAFVNILNFLGEPFLSKDIIKMIKYSQRKALVILFSNLTILPNPEELINSGLFEMNISIDTFDSEKYEFIRRSGDIRKILGKLRFNEKQFEIRERNGGDIEKKVGLEVGGNGMRREGDTLKRVVQNLRILIQTRKKLKKKLPIICINSVYSKETKEDAEDIVRNAIDLGVDRVKFQRLAPDDFGVLHAPDIDDVLHIIKLKEKYKDQIEIIPANFGFGSEIKGYCFHGHYMVVVDIFGNILPCCMPNIFEDIGNAKFGDFRNGEGVGEALEKREIFINNFRNNPPEFCKKCHLYIRK
jgi:MoaA/NifB/PqqE/SkfB family radical SAM enzyme